MNYVEAGRPVSSYYGSNLARLRAVKKRYDPTGFFTTPYSIP
ncbi:BBE domain-containing protein [Pseudonocardia xinjiangensis]